MPNLNMNNGPYALNNEEVRRQVETSKNGNYAFLCVAIALNLHCYSNAKKQCNI